MSTYRCPQCGAENRDGMTCAERIYHALEQADQDDAILMVAKYALTHPRTHSAHCVSLARSVVQYAEITPEKRCVC